jgi:hypothetical protein
MIAAQLVDIGWAILVLAGIERVRIDPSLPSIPVDLYYMPYTHSLPATLVWALLAFAVARAWLALVPAAAVGLVVASHWLLDLIVHRRDLPLWANGHKVGLALWDRPLVAFNLELWFFLGSVAVMMRSGALATAGRFQLWSFFVGLVGALVLFFVGPVPPGPRAALGTYVLIAWWAARVEASGQPG